MAMFIVGDHHRGTTPCLSTDKGLTARQLCYSRTISFISVLGSEMNGNWPQVFFFYVQAIAACTYAILQGKTRRMCIVMIWVDIHAGLL